MSALKIVERLAREMFELGHDADLVITLPPRIFMSLVNECKHLMEYPDHLPGETSIMEWGEPPSPAEVKFPGPGGWVHVRPGAQQ